MVLVKMLVSPDMDRYEVLLSWQDMIAIGVINKDFPNMVSANKATCERQIEVEDEGEGEPRAKVNREEGEKGREEEEEDIG